MLQIKMSLKAKLKAIKLLTISLFWNMVDQTTYYKLINLYNVVLKEIWALKNRIPVVERTEAEMVAVIILTRC